MIVGKKLAMVNTMDNAMASTLSTGHTIELVLTKSPRKKVRCGAIAVFRLNEIPEIQWKEGIDPVEKFEAQKELNEMSDTMLRDPELFKESDGRWIPWALERVMEIFDELGTDADIIVKSPKLRIRHKIPRSEVVSHRSDPRKLFHIAFDIDKLLKLDFAFDPWGRVIRKGHIGAEFSKR